MRTENPRGIRGLRLQLYIQTVLLILTLAVGIIVNLSATLPASDKGDSMFAAFGAALASGPASLSIHATLGSLVVLAGISVLIRAVTSHRAGQIILAAVGLLAVLMAWTSGTGFVGDQTNGASMSMAIGTAVALLCYTGALYALPAGPRSRVDAAVAGTAGGTAEGAAPRD